MYKWFVWSYRLKKYLPVPGLSATPRGACAPVLVDMFGRRIAPTFCIPMFGVHNAVKYEV